MLKTNLHAKFGIVADVRPVEDPWGLGVVFQVRRIDAAEYQDWLKERNRANPLFAQLLQAQGRAFLKAIAGGKKKVDQQEVTAAIVEFADKAELRPEDVDGFLSMTSEGTAKLLAGWSGLLDTDGHPIDFSEANAVELLASPELVPEDAPYGGQPLGRALNQFLLEEAARSEAYRQSYLEGAEKN